MSAPKLLVVGFASAAVNPKNLPLGISAGVTIAQAGSVDAGLATVAVFSVVASAVVLVAVVAVVVLGERTRQPLDELKDWLLVNGATIMVVVFTLLGAKMLGSGLALTG